MSLLKSFSHPQLQAKFSGVSHMLPKILIIDDEVLIALDMEAALADGGLGEAVLAHDVATAMGRLESEDVACVVLDAHLHGESAEVIADRLRAEARPFVVTTGYSAHQLPWLRGAPLLIKPVDPDRLAGMVRDLLGGAGRPRD